MVLVKRPPDLMFGSKYLEVRRKRSLSPQVRTSTKPPEPRGPCQVGLQSPEAFQVDSQSTEPCQIRSEPPETYQVNS